MAVRLSRRKLASYYADSLVDGADPKKLAAQLAAYLVETRRTKELYMVVGDIENHLAENGVVSANVTSAHGLGKLTSDAIIGLVKKTTDATDVQLIEYIDSGVIGGVKLKFAGLELDTTVSRQLTKLRTHYNK